MKATTGSHSNIIRMIISCVFANGVGDLVSSDDDEPLSSISPGLSACSGLRSNGSLSMTIKYSLTCGMDPFKKGVSES